MEASGSNRNDRPTAFCHYYRSRRGNFPIKWSIIPSLEAEQVSPTASLPAGNPYFFRRPDFRAGRQRPTMLRTRSCHDRVLRIQGLAPRKCSKSSPRPEQPSRAARSPASAWPRPRESTQIPYLERSRRHLLSEHRGDPWPTLQVTSDKRIMCQTRAIATSRMGAGGLRAQRSLDNDGGCESWAAHRQASTTTSSTHRA
jgi:hypothetical protein